MGRCCIAAYASAFWVHGEALLDYEFDRYRTRLGKLRYRQARKEVLIRLSGRGNCRKHSVRA